MLTETKARELTDEFWCWVNRMILADKDLPEEIRKPRAYALVAASNELRLIIQKYTAIRRTADGIPI